MSTQKTLIFINIMFKIRHGQKVQKMGLPSIRKYGYYRLFNNPNTLIFKIENEYDVHTKVVQFIR